MILYTVGGSRKGMLWVCNPFLSQMFGDYNHCDRFMIRFVIGV